MSESVYDVRRSKLNPNRYRLELRPKGERTQGRPPHGEVWAKKCAPAEFYLVDEQGEDYAGELRDKQVICPRCGRPMAFGHTRAIPAYLPIFKCEKCAIDCENDPISVI